MVKEPKKKQVLQWHPAFYAGIQIEFSEEAQKLIFENEHQLGTKPKEIDVLIVKKKTTEVIYKNLGKIFRKYNIIEYKSPDDYVSIDDYYKVLGYACFFKSDVSGIDTIKVEDITVSFVCSHCPHKLRKHLTCKRHLEIYKQEKGIYYIEGEIFPVQFILISELDEESNFWLKNLTDNINGSEVVQKILHEYAKHENEGLYKSVMNIIVNANKEAFEEVKGMCEALLELMKDEIEERKRGNTAGIAARDTTRDTTRNTARNTARNGSCFIANL